MPGLVPGIHAVGEGPDLTIIDQSCRLSNMVKSGRFVLDLVELSPDAYASIV